MLKTESSILVLIDVQEKLAAAMHKREDIVANTLKLVQGAKILGVPIIRTEQNPQGIGQTLPEIRPLLTDSEPITKFSFNSCKEPRFIAELDKWNRHQIIVCGIESHVCVYQTVVELIERGYEVEIPEDCISSRTPENRAVGLERCKRAGAAVTSVEMVLFELLGTAEDERFRQMLKIIK